MKPYKRVFFFIMLLVFSVHTFADEYVVQNGDTLRMILKKQGFEGNEQDLHKEILKVVKDNAALFKNGSPDNIQPGMVFLLANYRPEPEPEPVPEPELAPEPEIILPPDVGVLIVVRGTANIVRDNNVQSTSSNDALYSGDKVVTSADTLVLMEMSDGSLFELGPNTEFSLDEFIWTSDEKVIDAGEVSQKEAQSSVLENVARSITTLIRGVVRSVTGKIGQRNKDDLRLNTRAASIGIRGTDYTIRYCDGENCGALAGASVAVVDGGVGLNNDGGNVELNKGEFARAESASSVPFAAPMPEGFLDLTLDISDVKVIEPTWWDKLSTTFSSYFK